MIALVVHRYLTPINIRYILPLKTNIHNHAFFFWHHCLLVRTRKPRMFSPSVFVCAISAVRDCSHHHHLSLHHHHPNVVWKFIHDLRYVFCRLAEHKAKHNAQNANEIHSKIGRCTNRSHTHILCSNVCLRVCVCVLRFLVCLNQYRLWRVLWIRFVFTIVEVYVVKIKTLKQN